MNLSIDSYLSLSNTECTTRIVAAKATLGKRLVILGHHYQRQEVFQHADFTGDSLKLSRQAAQSEAHYIVFCGVHFMAEVADILSREEQIAILPDLTAGCSMADMANLSNVARVWQELAQVLEVETQVTPVTYINSAANLKAFCGEHGGIVCTSSNAPKVLAWSFAQREKVLFFPDQHLGRNTGYRMNIPLEQMVLWDFSKPLGGLTIEQIQQARLILWNGFCGVHQVFQPQDIDNFRKQHPTAQVIAHPECSFEVCQKSDAVGSTEFIIKTVQDSPPGTRWLVGTELNLVQRLAAEILVDHKFVHYMSPYECMCPTMYRVDPQHLCWVLENLVAGHVVNAIQVADTEKVAAKRALQAMLAIG
jgi:quinolinate synthase